MKIIRPYPRRRKAVADTLVDLKVVEIKLEAKREPQKKALMIGIKYDGGRAKDQKAEDDINRVELHGPHKDVQAMRQFLIDTYGYKSENITLLMDKDGYVQPTRVNILREISNLIKDAQAGDTFFFHYCGHGSQVENRNNSEEDGMDECILPADADLSQSHKYWIRDNELRRHLVDPLPVGSNLIAIFDSCHSESLLDLYHSRCNRVWVPWISKGKRRSNSLMNKQVKRLAMDDRSAVVVSRRIYQSKRISSGHVHSRRTSIDKMRPIDGVVMDGITARLGRLSINVNSVDLKSELVSSPVSQVASPTQQSWWSTNMTPITRCESPVPEFCTGNCRDDDRRKHIEDESILANVISIGACKDDQISWEDDDGASMTAALIEVLRQEPYPTYRNMMLGVSHRLHELSMKVHQKHRQYKYDYKQWRDKQAAKGRVLSRSASDGAILETDNFQDPQLSSHKPLNLDDRLRLG